MNHIWSFDVHIIEISIMSPTIDAKYMNYICELYKHEVNLFEPERQRERGDNLFSAVHDKNLVLRGTFSVP